MDRSRLLLWLVRVLWTATGVFGSLALERLEVAFRAPVLILAALGWLVGVGAVTIISVVGLTVARTVITLSLPVGLAVAMTSVEPVTIAFAACSALTTALVLSAEFAHLSVQASAYGDEERLVLRTPAGFALAGVVVWILWAAALIIAALAAGNSRWWVAGTLGALVAAITIGALPRWNLAARRWLVLVPAGVVVHDPLVLAETLMLRRSDIARIGLAPVDTTALDLTGPSSGHAIEIDIVAPVPVLVATRRRGQTVRPAEASAVLVAPLRPGRALQRAQRRRLPVGPVTSARVNDPTAPDGR